MESEGSLPHSQAPATCLYPEPEKSSPCLPISLFCRSGLILSSCLCMCCPNGLFPSVLPTKTPYAPLHSSIHAMCPTHLIFLDLIIQIIFVAYKFQSSSLCSLFQSHVTSSLLGPNIFVSTLFLNTFSPCSSLNVRDQI
jgi:hypothetical protein